MITLAITLLFVSNLFFATWAVMERNRRRRLERQKGVGW